MSRRKSNYEGPTDNERLIITIKDEIALVQDQIKQCKKKVRFARTSINEILDEEQNQSKPKRRVRRPSAHIEREYSSSYESIEEPEHFQINLTLSEISKMVMADQKVFRPRNDLGILGRTGPDVSHDVVVEYAEVCSELFERRNIAKVVALNELMQENYNQMLRKYYENPKKHEKPEPLIFDDLLDIVKDTVDTMKTMCTNAAISGGDNGPQAVKHSEMRAKRERLDELTKQKTLAMYQMRSQFFNKKTSFVRSSDNDSKTETELSDLTIPVDSSDERQ